MGLQGIKPISTVLSVADSATDAARMVGRLFGESGSESWITGELFHMTADVAWEGLRDAGVRGVRGRLIFNGRMPGVMHHREELEALCGFAARPYAGPGSRLMLHTKAFTSTGGDGSVRAVVTTACLKDTWTSGVLDIGVLFDGPAARAVRELTLAAHLDDPDVMRRSAKSACALGILVNDPAAGVLHATEGFLELLRGAERSFEVITKTLDDAVAISELRRAARRGVRVRVVARTISDGAIRKLEKAGVDVTKTTSTAHPLHMNAVIADDSDALFGTMYLSARPLGTTSKRVVKLVEDGRRLKVGPRRGGASRELLAYTTDRRVIDAIRRISTAAVAGIDTAGSGAVAAR